MEFKGQIKTFNAGLGLGAIQLTEPDKVAAAGVPESLLFSAEVVRDAAPLRSGDRVKVSVSVESGDSEVTSIELLPIDPVATEAAVDEAVALARMKEARLAETIVVEKGVENEADFDLKTYKESGSRLFFS